MVFVFKDYSIPVARVNNIPVDSLEAIKEWLEYVLVLDVVFFFYSCKCIHIMFDCVKVDELTAMCSECNIKFYEGPTNLNWGRIMATIRNDVDQFFEDGMHNL
jgi:nucleosome binding factor SPN SPT16 subunit